MCDLLKNPAIYSAIAAIFSAVTAFLAYRVNKKNYQLLHSKSLAHFEIVTEKISKTSETHPANQIRYPFSIIFKNIGESIASDFRAKIVIFDRQGPAGDHIEYDLEVAENISKNQTFSKSISDYSMNIMTVIAGKWEPRSEYPYVCIKLNYKDIQLEKEKEQLIFRQMNKDAISLLEKKQYAELKTAVDFILLKKI